MAKKTILGVDVGYDQLKLALMSGGRIVKTASASMPENLMKDGRVTSADTLGDMIRQIMKINHMRASHAAIVLPGEDVYVKNVRMPQMTAEQLLYNLPFEFNDYITGEIKDYVFDYAMLVTEDKEKEEDGQEPLFPEEGAAPDNDVTPTMELMAVGAQRSLLEETRDFLRKAGLKMHIAAPALCSYISLIREKQNMISEDTDEFGILDLGYNAIRMYMFKGDRHMATRVMEIGMSSIDGVLADAYGVDTHLAHTYLMSNFENCQEREECLTSYDNIAIELMRALNFYRFSNPDSALSDLWLCGGGAMIKPLTDAIGDMLDMEMHPAEELIPGGKTIPECCSFIQAIGITFE